MENINPYKMMGSFVKDAPIGKYVKAKNGFDYLPWSIAYHYVKTVFPSCRVVKEEFMNKDGVLVPYMIDAQGHAFVKCTIIWEGLETSEIFPITDFRNQSIKNPTSKDVDNSLQRCMTKCVAMFCGLGLSLWHGEDLISEPVEAVGVDSSAQQAVEGSASATNNNSSKSMSMPSGFADPSVAEVHTPLKKTTVPLAQLIKLAPDIEALKDLFGKHQGTLTPADKDLFSARKKELLG